MAVHVSESDGSITLTIDGRHRGIKLEDAEDLLEELEEAVESATEHRDWCSDRDCVQSRTNPPPVGEESRPLR